MRWFTSDLHFGHEPILSFCNRPFLDVTGMDDQLIYNINCMVKPNDLLYILGDFSFYPSGFNKSIVKDIKCPVVLIKGNHDHSGRIKNVGFQEMYDELDIQIGKYIITMSHFPYKGDHTAVDRYQERRPKDNGLWLLHGHTHSTQKYDKANRMIHVGTDAWNYHPINEDDIANIINNKL